MNYCCVHIAAGLRTGGERQVRPDPRPEPGQGQVLAPARGTGRGGPPRRGFNYPDNREKRLFDFGKSMLIAKAVSNPPTNAVARKDRSTVPTVLDGKEVGRRVISIPRIEAMIATH